MEDLLVHDVQNLKYVVERMASTKKVARRYVEFSNIDDTIHFIMFAERVESDIYVDVEYVEGLRNQRAIDVIMETNDPDDDDFFKFFTFRIHLGTSKEELHKRYEDLRDDLNDAYGMTICASCDARFKHTADEDACLLCIMKCRDPLDAMRTEFCAVCQDVGKLIGMKKLSCCKNYVHAACVRKLRDPKCPYCRGVSAA